MGLIRKELYRSTGKIRGVIFIPTLFAILVVSTLITLLLQRESTLSSVATTILSGENQELRHNSYLSIEQPISGTCQQNNNAPANTSPIACQEPLPKLSTSPPLQLPEGIPDLTSIFQSISACPSAPIPTSGARFNAPTSPFTCALKALTLNKSLAVRENLRISDLHVASSVPLVIASLGSVSIDAITVSGGDFLLVAGGEVRISSVTSNSDNRSKGTILSARGDTEVTTATGKISLLLISRTTMRGPPTDVATPFPLPNFRRLRLLGVIPAHRLP